jgi:hypothetical protein
MILIKWQNEDRKPRDENRKPRDENRKPRDEDRKPRDENRKPRDEDRKPRDEDRKWPNLKRQKRTSFMDVARERLTTPSSETGGAGAMAAW